MKFSVIDACFPEEKQSYGLSALWLKWELSRYKIDAVPLRKAGCLLVTVVSPTQAKYIDRLKKAYPEKIIFVGGAGALSPHAFSLSADAVCVGNGRNFIKTLVESGPDAAKALPESFCYGEDRQVDVADGFPWDCPPIQAEDGAYRVWCGRGCKIKCAFCQTGWGVRYEENPNPESLIRSIKRLRDNKLKVGYLSNDPMQHSFFNRLPLTVSGSYSFSFIKRNGLPNARQVRIGIEGVSERVRGAIGKPIGHEDLIKCTAWLNASKKSVRWFMIAGVPGETNNDWDELKSTVLEWKKLSPKGVLALSFTAFERKSATPLGLFITDSSYYDRYNDFKNWFFHGSGFSHRIKIMDPMMPKTRDDSASKSIGVLLPALQKTGYGPNERVNYPNKKNRLHVAKKYSEIMGIDCPKEAEIDRRLWLQRSQK